MTALAHEKILLIADHDRQLYNALTQVLPDAQVTAVPSYFEAIADLAHTTYTTILAAAAPIERRPEPAVRALRELARHARLLAFGGPGYEPLSRKMLDFGLDDYLITPVSPAELQQMFGAPPLRILPAPPTDAEHAPSPAGRLAMLSGLPLADILIESLVQQPNLAPATAIAAINAHIGPTMQLALTAPGQPPPSPPEGMLLLSHATRSGDPAAGTLHLLLPRDEDETAARHLLAQLARTIGGLHTLEQRHQRLMKLAFTDDLTGLSNSRYFWLQLEKRISQAAERYSLVTLLLFDIDNFKSYNDQYGHCIGDEILKQTARLIRGCVREHDHVARISGDEFAVIFWEKEGPRQPRDPKATPSASRVPQTIVTILERFRHAIANSDLKMLGPKGRGVLSISGGLAVYPFDASDARGLYEAADRALMFGAKRGGKNSIYLIGGEDSEHSRTP